MINPNERDRLEDDAGDIALPMLERVDAYLQLAQMFEKERTLNSAYVQAARNLISGVDLSVFK